MSDSQEFIARPLGNTGLNISPLGVADGYGTPSYAFEMAFEKGCNYFSHDALFKSGLVQAVKNICNKGKREKLIIAANVFMRTGFLFKRNFESRLKKLGLEYLDVLIMGWHNRAPAEKYIDIFRELKREGKVRFLGISGHNRSLFPILAKTGDFDVFQIRYNAAHRGAEKDIFHLLPRKRPGIVSYTATAHRKLFKKPPPGLNRVKPVDCYRFVLSNPNVDAVMTGPKTVEQMEENLKVLELGPLSSEEMKWIATVGDYVK